MTTAGYDPMNITPREHQALKLLDLGLTRNEMAEALGISAATLGCHLTSIYHKLDVRNRVEALRKARALGLL